MATNSSLLKNIKTQLQQIATTQVQSQSEIVDLYKFYILSLIVKAAQNEGALVRYQDALGHYDPEQLVFRQRAGQLYDVSESYTHAVILFDNKPPLELHMGVKVQGRLQILYDCDLCIIYKIEAEGCRTNQRIPRASGILMTVDCQYHTAELPLESAQAFVSLSSEVRVTGNCYFVSNTTSDLVAKLLANRKRKWDYDIVPQVENNVNRLMYDFQNTFKDFKAK
ncbi:MAG: hypothetical protein ACFBSC_10545 [Microcoleaceae cyanobacterium]